MGVRGVAFAVALLLWAAPALGQRLKYRPHHSTAAASRSPKVGFQRLPQVYVVNLPTRKDMLAQVTHELAAVGVSNFSVTPGIVHQCGALWSLGALGAHLFFAGLQVPQICTMPNNMTCTPKITRSTKHRVSAGLLSHLTPCRAHPCWRHVSSRSCPFSSFLNRYLPL